MKRKLLLGGVFSVVALLAAYFYFAWQKQEDTAGVKSDYTVDAESFIKEFETDAKNANIKYTEKIIEVKGIIAATEAADTTINIKMADTTTGSYIIFAFQNIHLNEAKNIKKGDMVTIKGSCSGGILSEILGTNAITFKRSTLIK